MGYFLNSVNFIDLAAITSLYKIKHIPKTNILKTQNMSQNQGESWISNVLVLFQNHHQGKLKLHQLILITSHNFNWSNAGFEIKPKYYWFNFCLDFDLYSVFSRCPFSEYVLSCTF